MIDAAIREAVSATTERLSEVVVRGRRVLCVDLAGMQLRQKAEFYEVIEALRKRVAAGAPRSLLIATNVTNSAFDADVSRTMASCARHNGPYVKASALVGVSGIQTVVLAAIKAQTGREFYLARSMPEALAWLAAQ